MLAEIIPRLDIKSAQKECMLYNLSPVIVQSSMYLTTCCGFSKIHEKCGDKM